jgi:aminotransferase
LAAEYAASRDVLLGYLDQTGLSYTRPEGAYFVMLDISPFGYASDVEFAHWMTKEIGVAPVPGSSFFCERRKPLRAAQLCQEARDAPRRG